MKFFRPQTLDEAIAILAAEKDARCVAGGQTLAAMLNADLLAPAALVALDGIAELRGIAATDEGVRIGAMALHREVAAATLLWGTNRVIREAAAQIGHPAIRNLGTIGGSLCHGDPVSDYPAAVVAAGAELELRGSRGARRVPAAAFFRDFLTTELAGNEIMVAVHLPRAAAAGEGHYLKYARAHGDYATVSVAVCLALRGGQCAMARIALGGCGPVPVVAPAAELALVDTSLDEAAMTRAGEALAQASNPLDDTRGSAEYRRMIIPRLVRRAITTAKERL